LKKRNKEFSSLFEKEFNREQKRTQKRSDSDVFVYRQVEGVLCGCVLL